MTAYYNSAALSGGMSVADAFNAFNGGWEIVESGNWNGYPVYAPDQTEAARIQNILNEIGKKYTIDPNRRDALNNLVRIIFTYDSYLMNGRPEDAHNLKTAYISGMDQPEVVKKLWTYIRSRMHKGFSTHPKITKLMRENRKFQVNKLRADARALLKRSPWVGSAPYVGDGLKILPAYRYLSTPWGTVPRGYQAYSPYMARNYRIKDEPMAAAPSAVLAVPPMPPGPPPPPPTM